MRRVKPRRTPGVTVNRLHARVDGGTKEVWFGLAETIVKYDEEEPERSALVAVEFIAARMAMMLGLPVPMGDAATIGDRRRDRVNKAWVSAEIRAQGISLPPPDPEDLLKSHVNELAGCFVFDTWILNGDRTEENVLYEPAVGFWMIDHEDALGGTAILDPDRLDRLRSRIEPWRLIDPNRLPLDPVRDWSRNIAASARHVAKTSTEEAWRRRLISREQQTAIMRFLTERGDNLFDLVRRLRRGGTTPWQTSSLPGTSSSSLPIFDVESPGTSE